MAEIHQPVELDPPMRLRSRPELRIELDPHPNASCAARDALEIFAGSVSADTFANLRVVVTELVTNGVKYGPGGPIALSVALDADGFVRGDVNDGGTGGVRMRAPGAFGGGLGLVIVEALADWGVHPDSSHVWFELDRVDSPPALV